MSLGAVGCGGAGNDATAEQAGEKRAIERDAVQESPFKPADLEASIDGLIRKLDKAETPETFDLAVITKPFGGYWEPVKVGANRAMAELELSGEVVAPADAADPDITTERQIELFKDRREAGYGGVAIAPMRDSLTKEINAMVADGAPVVTIDSDLDASKRQLYIGTNNGEAGKTAGETLSRLLGRKAGTVFILGYDDEDWPDGFARTEGARKVLRDAGHTVVVRRVGWTEEETAADFEYLTEAVPNADPPVVGMIGMFSNAYRNAQVAEMVGFEPGDVKIVAFDFEPDTLAYMKDGYIQATHVQRQYYMGYLVPYAIYSIRVLGFQATRRALSDHMIDAHRFDTGVDAVEADEIEDYEDFLDSLGVGG
jgi:ribose transport system substrate-binding protein